MSTFLQTFKKRARRRPPLVRLAWQLLLFAVVIGLGEVLLHTPELVYLEQQASGVRMRWRQDEDAERVRRRIVLVTITDETDEAPALARLPGTSLPRRCHAKVIRELKAAGAKVIAFDVQFDQADIRPKEDEAFIAAVRDCPPVVTASLWQDYSANVLPPMPALLKAGSFYGHIRFPNHENSPILDRVEPTIVAKSGIVPSFSLQVARLATNPRTNPRTNSKKPPWLRWEGNTLRAGKISIPLNDDGTFKISFFTKSTDANTPQTGEDAFPSVPYHVVYEGIAKHPMLREHPEFFKDKIVLIGDESKFSHDYHHTPVGRMFGVAINAHAIATLLQGEFIANAGDRGNWTVLLCLTALAWLLAARLSLRRVLPGALLLLAGYLLVNSWLFVERDWDAVLVAPLIAAALMTFGVVVERGWNEEEQIERMTSVLVHYVSPQISQNGMPSGEMTLVFTDIEGSATLSEQFKAEFEQVRAEHFHLLREAARQWNGVEIETAGDSLFVVFARAADALRFAVEGQRALARHSWPAGMGGLQVRVGMHTGVPFVARDRTRYVVRGPVTNRAARVMDAARGGQIVLSQRTLELARPRLEDDETMLDVTFRDLGLHTMRGIGEERLWELCHCPGTSPDTSLGTGAGRATTAAPDD